MWVIHNNDPLVEIDLCIRSSLSNQSDNPLLALLGRQIQPFRKILDIDDLMNSTVRFRNQMSRTFNKLIRQTGKKKVTFQHRLNLHQSFLRQLEIEINIQCSDKFSNWIRILVSFLFDDAHEFTDLFLVLIRILLAEVRGYDCGGDVTKDPGT